MRKQRGGPIPAILAASAAVYLVQFVLPAIKTPFSYRHFCLGFFIRVFQARFPTGLFHPDFSDRFFSGVFLRALHRDQPSLLQLAHDLLHAALADPAIQVVCVPSARAANVLAHERLHTAVADALG